MGWDTDWLSNRARLSPDRVAVVDGELNICWTYEQLHKRAERLAAYLIKCGVEKGERIALLSPNHISYFDLLFATTKIGAIFVPLNWRLALNEIKDILHDCKPKLLFCHLSKKEQLATMNSSIIYLDKNYELLLMEERKSQFISVNSDDPAVILYTGGTTGKPKGVVLSHRSILFNAINTIISWNLKQEDTTLTYLPMFHSGGLNALSIPLLHVGGKVVLAQQFEAERAIDLIEQEQCTIVLFVPTMYHQFIQSERFLEAEFSTMHTFLSGGAPCSFKIYEAFVKKGITFKEGYGLTEAGPNNFYLAPNDANKRRGSVGKPMMYNEVKVVNKKNERAKANEVGEILLRGDHLFTEYWGDEETTNEAIVDGWFHTGDLGKYDENGYFYIVGRKKDMIITGGENVYPLEVEHVIAKLDAVSEVAVVGIEDEQWGELVSAHLVVKKGRMLTQEEVIRHCRLFLANYKIPKKILFVDELPKTPVGKIDKQKLVTL